MQNISEEGYIKFQCHWKESAPYSMTYLATLNEWRQKLYDANLVGAYPNGVGFGNVSRRINERQFYISGSKTGNFSQLDQQHYAKVVDYNFETNEVWCEGPVIASSESMSHAAVYQQLPQVNAVFHVHHLVLWKKVLDKIPCTDKSVTYGTPEMAAEIIRLIEEKEVLKNRVFVMGGHLEGLIAFGGTLDEAGAAILQTLKTFLDQ